MRKPKPEDESKAVNPEGERFLAAMRAIVSVPKKKVLELEQREKRRRARIK